jgi:hypothetical protein
MIVERAANDRTFDEKSKIPSTQSGIGYMLACAADGEKTNTSRN